MAIPFTFDDPKAPTQPFTYKRVYMLHPDWKVTEHNCTDEDEGKDDFHKKIKAPAGKPSSRSSARRADLRTVFLCRCGNRLEGGAPAAFADFIRVDEIVGRLAALLAFERHRPRHAAHF
jgi:hypothetical protein